MINYKAYCKHLNLNPDALASARAYRHYYKTCQKRYQARRQAEDDIRKRLHNSTHTDAVEKHALLAIINGNHTEANRLLDILKRRNKGFRVIRRQS